MKIPAILIAACIVPTVSLGQTLQYEATIGPDGKVELTPKGGATQSETTVGEETVTDSLFIVKNPAGVVKGVFASQTDALREPLEPGDVLETYATTAGINPVVSTAGVGIDTSGVREAAEKVAQEMLEQTRSVICEMAVRPTTFTTGAEISFSFFAGTTLQVSATWDSATVCPNKP